MTTPDIQTWSSVILTFLTGLTLLVLIKYTYETTTLRKAAQAQNEISVRPIVALTLEEEHRAR